MLTPRANRVTAWTLHCPCLPPRPTGTSMPSAGHWATARPSAVPVSHPQCEQRPAHVWTVPSKAESGPAGSQPLPGHGSCPTATSGGRVGHGDTDLCHIAAHSSPRCHRTSVGARASFWAAGLGLSHWSEAVSEDSQCQAWPWTPTCVMVPKMRTQSGLPPPTPSSGRGQISAETTSRLSSSPVLSGSLCSWEVFPEFHSLSARSFQTLHQALPWGT